MDDELASLLQLPEPEIERRQCVTKVVAAGILSRDGGIPTEEAVSAFSLAIRKEQFNQASRALETMGKPADRITAVEHELRVHAHDATKPRHDKDFRVLAAFVLEELAECKMVVLRKDYRGGLLIETISGTGNISWHFWCGIWRGHMYLLVPPAGLDPTAWLAVKRSVILDTLMMGWDFYSATFSRRPRLPTSSRPAACAAETTGKPERTERRVRFGQAGDEVL